jgi:hypothetical protein
MRILIWLQASNINKTSIKSRVFAIVGESGAIYLVIHNKNQVVGET